MQYQIVCGKCGHVNNTEPTCVCTNCGDHLYQYFMRNRRIRLFIKTGAISTVLLAIIIIVYFSYYNRNPTQVVAHTKKITDQAHSDLVSYLKQISIQNNNIYKSEAAKNFQRYILGFLNSDDKSTILAKLGLREEPAYQADKWDTFNKEVVLKSVSLIKSKSIKEKFQIRSEHCEAEATVYSIITPLTNEIESIHSHLIKSKELCVKAYNSFVLGMNLGYIYKVTETKDGQYRWRYNMTQKEYSENYKKFIDEAENEYKIYIRKLEQLVQRYNALQEYKAAYPFEGYLKESHLNKQTNK